jgi:hypothetical protein
MTLADLPTLRALLASAPSLPTDPQARAAFERAAAWVFDTCDRLAAFAGAVGGRSSCN